MENPPVIALVIPCYNEHEALPLTLDTLKGVLAHMADQGIASPQSYILCVDDGSKDDTWHIIEKAHLADKYVKGIALAHNRGHQLALLAGLHAVTDHCDAAISIDADLQDDPAAIPEMVQRFNRGKEIVYGVRASRATDTKFKRGTAHAFYSLQQKMGVDTIYDHADFRLMSNRALQLLGQYTEANVFLRGLVPQIGLEQDIVTYNRNPRVAGTSKYPLSKMLALSVDGITSFSARPLRWIFLLGCCIFLITLGVAVYVLISYFFKSHISAGWTSLMLSVWGLGSLILMAIGIVGEYVGKMFNEVKQRPRYAVRDRLWD